MKINHDMNGTCPLVPVIHIQRNKKVDMAHLLRMTIFIDLILED